MNLQQLTVLKMPEDKQKYVSRWTDKFLPMLWEGQIKELKKKPKFKDGLKRGVPVQIRGEVWSLLIGNLLRITPLLYESLLARVRTYDKNHDEFPQFKKNIKIIDADLHRTFTDLAYFRQGGNFHHPLRNVLAAFSLYRTDLGYVQGMSYVAGTLLIHLNDEYATFSAFTNLMQQSLMFTFYSFDMQQVNIFFNVFMTLMKTHIPKLYAVFEEMGLQCSIFLFEWVVTVFTNILPLPLAARLWDSWLYYGEAYFMRICLAICLCLMERVNSTGNADDKLMKLFKAIDNYLNEEILFAKIDMVRLKTSYYDRVKQEVMRCQSLKKLI